MHSANGNEQFKDDSDLVEWSPMLLDIDEHGNKVSTPLKTHKCTEDDFSKFNPPHVNQAAYFDYLNQTQVLWCLEKKDVF